MAKKVLIVDHATFMRMKMRDILQKNGYEVVGECLTAESVLSQLEKLSPDLVITEVRLKESAEDAGASGISMAKETLKQYPAVTVMICTHDGWRNIEDDCRQAGAKGFVRKPFQPETLIKAVRDALGE